MLLVELCSKKIYFIVSAINEEDLNICMSRAQLYAGISLKVQSNWKFSKYFLPSLGMKLSGDPNIFFSKVFYFPVKVNADLNDIETFVLFCFYLSSLWCSFILVGIRWNCQFASLRKIFSLRSNPSSFFFSNRWKPTKRERLSRQKLNQATHCIKNFYANSKKLGELFLMKYFTLWKTGAFFFPCLTRPEIHSIRDMENITTFPLFFTFCNIR